MDFAREPCGESSNAESCGKIENVRGQRSCVIQVYEMHHLHVKEGKSRAQSNQSAMTRINASRP